MNPSGGITSPTKHPTEPSTCVETFLTPDPGLSSDGGGVSRGQFKIQTASPPKNLENPTNFKVSNQGSDPPLSRNGFSTRRFSPYGSTKGVGALREIRVNDFVQETTAIGERRKGGDSSVALGLNPSEEGATDDGFTCRSPVGHATVMDTEMEGLKHLSSPANTQRDPHQLANSVWNSPVSGLESFAEKIKKSNEIIGLQLEYFPPSISPDGGCRIHISQEDLKLSAQQCQNKPNPMEEVECDHHSDSTPNLVLETAPVGLSSAPTVTKPRGLSVDEDGFTTVTRIKKMSPIKMQGRKQKPVRVRVASQQYDHVRPTGRQAPAGLNEKQLGKATQTNQGDKGGKNQQPLSSKIATPSKSIDIDSANRFSVLDIPNFIKLNKLIEVQDDLYPPDQSLEDGMDLDMTRSKDGQNGECQSNQNRIGDQFFPPRPSLVCQPIGQKLTTDHPDIEEKEEKDYGISNAQKMAITNRLCGPSRAVRAADMDNLDQGEHEFFEDQVKALGLDYDYCIEDVESDD
ncbi:hypothetical protein L1987_73048 [Smallanthus sonchifolius]|uniref:Uncharacterized protein n=1 Tax=Smallanthus sonchifolius TaxID=185202 RepID=A0ACB9AY93_9ASTR|nr:hypothetical protein L1987_73048 [Smallanthus sonchifolius]